MEFNLITIFPEMFSALSTDGVVGRAIARRLIKLNFFNPRDYTLNPQRKVDDKPFGGGGGMVMMVQPLFDALEAATARAKSPIIYLSPQGQPLTQKIVNELAKKPVLTLVAGRYEGFDERIFSLKPGLEISIGDFVVSGGELPAMLLIDALARQVEGVVGLADSVAQESFMQDRLDHPQYTRPQEFKNLKVPQVLVDGDHAAIEQWRQQQSLKRTKERRSDLFQKRNLTAKEQLLLNKLDQQ